MEILHIPHKVAGFLSLLAAILALAVWYILLFVATPSNIPTSEFAITSLGYFLFTEDPSRPFFIWLAVAPVVSIVLGISYLLNFSRSKVVAMVLFTLSVALGVSAFYFSNWALAFWVALPCYWGLLCVRQA